MRPLGVMRKASLTLGILLGAFVGWKLGSAFDSAIAGFINGAPRHMQGLAFAAALALLWGYMFSRASTVINQKLANVEQNAPKPVERPRVRSGLTPPAPRPAFQL